MYRIAASQDRRLEAAPGLIPSTVTAPPGPQSHRASHGCAALWNLEPKSVGRFSLSTNVEVRMDPLLGMALWPAALLGIAGLVLAARAAAGSVESAHDSEDELHRPW